MKRLRFFTLALIFALWSAFYVTAEENTISVDENRVILLADAHLGAYPEADALFADLVKRIVAMNPRPGRVLILGDLAGKTGTREEYAAAHRLIRPLEEAGIPWNVAIGNHDNRENLFAEFPEHKAEAEFVAGRHIQMVHTPRADFILLDSRRNEPEIKTYMAEKDKFPNRNPWDGYEDPLQTEWLEKTLNICDQPVYVCAHHPLEEFPIADVLMNSDVVRGYLYGHVHKISFNARMNTLQLPTTSQRVNGSPSGWVELELGETSDDFYSRTFEPSDFENVRMSIGHPAQPTNLMTDLLEDTETVYESGFTTDVKLPEAAKNQQFAEIRTLAPTFGWVVNDGRFDVLQTAYQIQVKVGESTFDTGKIESDASCAVQIPDLKLEEGGVYSWRVKTWNNGSESPWSDWKSFRVGRDLKPFDVSSYPLHWEVETPQTSGKISDTTTFCDFGRAAFGQLRLTVTAKDVTEIRVRLGERVKDGAVDRHPAGSTRYREIVQKVEPGTHEIRIVPPKDGRNTSGAAVLMPAYMGEVVPYRYAEVECGAEVTNIERLSAYYHFSDENSKFQSSNDILNQVWDLCRYSIKATSFLGIYVDGDRERIPYEGDALLNQLSHYGVDREYTMARKTWTYLIFHPTWPTEWNLQCPQMAWYDYLYTGDARAVRQFYDELKAKSLLSLAEENGLISTRMGKLTPEVLKSIHFAGGPQFRDIVDWPHRGLAGNENADSGETDGFVFENFNSVVNAYHFFALNSMSKFAEITQNNHDKNLFENQKVRVQKSYNDVFFDANRGVYKDGEKTDHASLHGNMFPLAFGLVPDENKKNVAEFVKSRGMRCSVYGAQFLLEAIYNGGDGTYGLERMTATDLRGWFNMIRVGSTISLEAWDDRYKPNQDWNHAWGAAPANIIPRKLVGVEPLEPGCAKIRIKPQVGTLTEFSAKVPLIRGTVSVSLSPQVFQVEIPANVRAEVWIPRPADSSDLVFPVCLDFEERDGYYVIPELGSGSWLFFYK